MSISGNTASPKGKLQLGNEKIVLKVDDSQAGAATQKFTIDADSVLVSLFASTVDAELDVTVSTYGKDGEEVEIISFPQLTAATPDLIIKKAAATMSNIVIRATYTGAATFEARARGIGTGEASVRILGASKARASAKTLDIADGAQLVVPSSLTDRQGFIVQNWSPNAPAAVVYMGFSAAEAVSGTGWPLIKNASIGVDLAAGDEIYVATDTDGADVRIIEAGAE